VVDEPSLGEQVRGGLRRAAKWVLLPLVILAVLAGIAGFVIDRQNKADTRRVVKKIEQETAASSCGPQPVDCTGLASRTLGLPADRLPSSSSFGAFRFSKGERSGKLLLLIYEDRSDQLFLVVSASPSQPAEPLKPGQTQTTSPGGKRYVETASPEGQVTRFDMWESGFKYVVSFQGTTARGSPKYEAGIALLDGAGSRKGA
jgi:hypothetical protein